jgi:hypothetical protein
LEAGVAKTVETESRTWTWLGSIGALCENVGVNGAYRVNVEARVEKGAEGKIMIRSMTLFVTGAVVDKDSTTSTAKLEVKQGSAVVNTIVLSRPNPDTPSIEIDPKPGESRRLYLPKSKPTIEIPAGAKISFTVTAQKSSAEGACSLGVSKNVIDPFQSH